MDWIEQIFGIDPDLGSGSLEMLITGAVVLVVAGIIVTRRSKKAQEKQTG